MSAAPDPPAPVLQCHPIFYLEDGSLILRTTSRMLYNLVYRTPLAKKSGFFAGLLGLPYHVDEGQERPPMGADFRTLQVYACLDGMSDEKALVLPDLVDADDLDYLFQFIFNFQRWSTKIPSLSSLVAILKLSHFFDVDSGMEYAIHHLDAPHLNAPLRLVLAITYDVDKWIATAFTSLMQIPMDKLSDNDEKLLGHQTYKLLVRTHAKIDTHRHDLASYPPTVLHAGYCVDQRSCAKAWDNAWFGKARSGMVSALLDAKLRGAALCSAMREFQVYGMPEDCRVRTLASIANTPEKRSGFKKESVIVEEAIKELMGHS
ncbi:hypothetical protein B0H11DRAFT_2273688 [Mycena galericulata]|nr:hypothetical protein B0H11DRAFT_2273688 [Mycena galericulata]